jgi:asparagine synthase (glutamine-hydrolysing)
MCGIFGFVGPQTVAESIDVAEIARSLRHRGPDACGAFRAINGDLACVFAHTRLAIIDLSDAGRQPMTSDDQRYTLVFNGEIYNFRTLRQELEQSGVRFKSHTDSEVVLQAYAAWGSKCVSRFRGIFAFAIWDQHARSLFLARDQLGVKPLYYTQAQGGLIFSSEIRTLMRSRLVERRISQAGLASYLTYGSVQDPLTILDRVVSLLPGHWLRYTGNAPSSEEYWTLRPGGDPPATFEEAVERIRPVLRESVAMQLVADVPVGVFLSGGVDSSALVALASESSTKPIRTFNVTFDEVAYDERQHAAAIANRFGCEHNSVYLPADRAVREFDDYIAALDQPSADGVNTFFVAKAAREAGLSVALSGTGGDEIFAGYPNFRKFGRLLTFGKMTRPLSPLLKASLRGSIRAKKLAAVSANGGDAAETYAVLRSMFSSEEVAALVGVEPLPDEIAVDVTDSVNAYSRLETTRYLRNTLLRDTDVMSMAHSLEVRVPLLDPSLVTSVFAIPGRMKIARSMNKPLLMRACNSLPAHIGRRKKMGFTLPMDVWFRGPLRARMQRVVDESSIWGFAGVRRLWEAYLAGSPAVTWSRIWTVVAAVEWMKKNEIELPAETQRPGAGVFSR